MSERKMDLLDLQREYGGAFTEGGFTQEDLERQTRKLRVLRFALDTKKVNIVSRLDGRIVFINRMYEGTVGIDDVWLCSVEESGTVYYATPLKKITAATAMEFDDRLRSEVTAALWEINKRAYVKIFEEKYREEMYSKATEEANARNSEIIRNLRDQVADLSKQVEQSKIVMESRETPVSEDEIELSSEDLPVSGSGPQVSLCTAVSDRPLTETPPPIIGGRSRTCVPGIPEIRHTDTIPRTEPVSQKYRVERLDAETLYSDSFADGKYFVHINLSGKFLVIRPNGYANVIATNHRMVLRGLGVMAKFTERTQLIAEYNSKYDGLLVYL